MLRSALRRIIVYCWTEKVVPATWRKGGFSVLIQKSYTKRAIQLQTYNIRTSLCKSFYIAYLKLNVQLLRK